MRALSNGHPRNMTQLRRGYDAVAADKALYVALGASQIALSPLEAQIQACWLRWQALATSDINIMADSVAAAKTRLL